MYRNVFLSLVIAGGLRVFLTQQSTFLLNSLRHTNGRTYYSSLKSAREIILVAVLTRGEGYHDFHHQYQMDYRNGIRWYHWDPTKWSIQSQVRFEQLKHELEQLKSEYKAAGFELIKLLKTEITIAN